MKATEIFSSGKAALMNDASTEAWYRGAIRVHPALDGLHLEETPI